MWVSACGGRPAPLIPEPLAAVPAESIAAWTGLHGPTRPTLLRFQWRYRDDRVGVRGRGAAQVAPPDSVRIDWVGPLGFGRGAAVVIGDSLVWANPKKDFPESPPPAVVLIWTALGVIRPPDSAMTVSGGRDSTQTVWRYVEGRDTISFRLSVALPQLLESEWRRDRRLIARGHTVLGPAGLPQTVRIDVPERPARFELTFVAVDTTATIAPEQWRHRR
jgi:hypothetical protein